MDKKSLVTSLILFTSFVHAAPDLNPYFTKEQPVVSTSSGTSPTTCEFGSKSKRLGVRHIEGKGIGYNRGYTTVEGFFGCQYKNSLPFLDVRGHVFDNGKWAANAGLGYRYQTDRFIYGLNAYYDYRKTSRHHYNQVGVGLEALSKHWDFRINGYWPVGDKSSCFYQTCFKKFECNNIIVSRKQEFAMKGVHAEAGAHIYNRHCPKYGNTELYVAFGPYYFEGKGKNAYGGQVRLLGKYKDWLTLQFSTSYDNVFHDIYQGEIALYLPFGKRERIQRNTKMSCEDQLVMSDRLVQPVYRDEIIVVDKHRKNFVAEDPCTCCPLEFIFVNNCFDGCGSFEDPFGSVREALDSSDPGDIIYIFPGNGLQVGMSAGATPFQLKDNQELLGAGICHDICTNFGIIRVPAQACELPILNADNDISVISVANNNTISGFNIRLWNTNPTIAPPFAIGSNGNTCNLIVKDNIIDAYQNGPIAIGGNVNGIKLTNASNDIIIDCNTINTNGIAFQSASDHVKVSYEIDNNILSGIGDTGIILAIDDSIFSSKITNNVMHDFKLTGARGIDLLLRGTTQAESLIANNKISSNNVGILFEIRGDTFSTADIIGNNLENNVTGIAFELRDDTSSLFNVTGNTVMSSSTGINSGLNENAKGVFNFQNNFLSSNFTGMLQFLQLNSNGTFNISSNEFLDHQSTIVHLIFDTATVTSRIEDNLLVNNTNLGIEISARGSATATYEVVGNTLLNSSLGITSVLSGIANTGNMFALIENNVIDYNNNNGMFLVNNGFADLVILNNKVNNTYVVTTIPLGIGIINTPAATMCLRFQGNESCTDVFQLTNTGTVDLEPLIGNHPELIVNGPVNNVSQGTCPTP